MVCTKINDRLEWYLSRGRWVWYNLWHEYRDSPLRECYPGASVALPTNGVPVWSEAGGEDDIGETLRDRLPELGDERHSAVGLEGCEGRWRLDGAF